MPVLAQGVVVDARIDHEVLAELALEPGRWHTIFPNDDDGQSASDAPCAQLVVFFDADDTELGRLEARATEAATAQPSGERVERTWADQAWTLDAATAAGGGR